MARNTMGLTLADLEILRVLVRERPRSHSAAARLVGLNRARLSRLIQRVNQQIGEDLDWRVGGRFRPPPEVRRLVSRYTAFAQELDQMGRAPRVSAGTSATLLLVEVIGELGRRLPRLDLVRSREILRTLECDEIDIALAHGRSVGLDPDSRRRELKPGITGIALIEWDAVVISRDGIQGGSQRSQVRACWAPGSTGEQLSREAGRSTSTQTDSGVNIPCQSFLHAIELVRRGLIAEAVVPNIYLPRPATGLAIEPPKIPVKDQLIAVFRTHEQPRWAWLFEESVWERITEHTRAAR